MKSSSIRVTLLASFGALATMAIPVVARAHPVLDEGIGRADEADFEGALAAFDRADRADDLGEEDVVTLLARRAAVHLALGHGAEAERDLRCLAALRPNYVFELWAPPALREAFERARAESEPVQLRLESEPLDRETRFTVIALGDPGGLVRDVRLSFRARPDGAWRSVGAATHVETGLAFEAYAEAIGPGGAVIARAGSQREPLEIGALEAPVDALALDPERDEGQDDGTLWWIVGGSGAAVAIAIAVTVAVLSTGGESDQTAFGPPMLRMP